MLQQHITRIVPVGTVDEPGRPRTDRAMDVLQYGMALLAIAGAALLAAFH